MWVMNVLAMPLNLGRSAFSPATTLPSVGFIITFMHLCCLVASVQLNRVGAGDQSAKDSDRTCSKMLLIKAITCLQVGPMSLDWPVDLSAGSDFSALPPEVPSGEQQRVAFPASKRSCKRQDALHAQPRILQRTTGWDRCGPFFSEGLRCSTRNTWGLVGSVFTRHEWRVLTQLSQKNFSTTTFVFRKCMVRTIFQAIQVLAPRFRFFGTFIPDNENAGGSAISFHRDLP